MPQVRFIGGPWDGMKMPWGDTFPLPERLAMDKVPQGSSRQYDPVPNGGAHLYDLDSDEAEPLYRYAGQAENR